MRARVGAGEVASLAGRSDTRDPSRRAASCVCIGRDRRGGVLANRRMRRA
jgi:hypothetical protein